MCFFLIAFCIKKRCESFEYIHLLPESSIAMPRKITVASRTSLQRHAAMNSGLRVRSHLARI